MSDQSSLSINVIVANIRPFLFVEKNEVRSSVSNLKVMMNYIPKNFNYTFKSIEGYHLGQMNSSGAYSGLIGYLQRGEADLVYHPVVISITDPPGDFTSPIYETGTRILSIVKYPRTIEKDITSSFAGFDASLMALFVFIFFSLILIQPLFLWQRTTFGESAFVLYKVMSNKSVGMRPAQTKSLVLFVAIFLYYFLASAIINSSLRLDLVVSDQVAYYDNLDDIFRRKSVTPHLLKNNYVTDYFQFSHGDKRKQEVYNRAKNCNCFHDTRDLLQISIREGRILSTLNASSAFIFEDRITKIAKRAICFGNLKWINEFGILHLSDLVYRTLAAVMYSKKRLPHHFEIELKRRFLAAFEFGISNKLKDGIASANFGFESTETPYHVCLNTNDMSSLHSVYNSITMFNLKTLTLIFSLIYGLVVLSLLLNFLWFKFADHLSAKFSRSNKLDDSLDLKRDGNEDLNGSTAKTSNELKS